MDNNFDVIETNIREYRSLKLKLNTLKQTLLTNREDASNLRKNFSKYDRDEYNEKLKLLNATHDKVKVEISQAKKRIKELYSVTENLIFDGVNYHYSEVYDKQLSKLYGYNVEIYVFEMGDNFDPLMCSCDVMIVTKDKAQHGKILNSKSFSIKALYNNVVEKKAKVEVCVYSKKHKAGEVLTYDAQIFLKG